MIRRLKLLHEGSIKHMSRKLSFQFFEVSACESIRWCQAGGSCFKQLEILLQPCSDHALFHVNLVKQSTTVFEKVQ